MKKSATLLFSAAMLIPAASQAFEEKITVNDKLGSGTVTATETVVNDSDENWSKDIKAMRTNKDGSVVWTIRDGVKECDVDSKAAEFNDRLRLTDLDDDGIDEIWVSYILACRGDPSPASMKIIMYEGKSKYAMRGETRLPVPVYDEKTDKTTFELQGGTYTFDKAFNEGPEDFCDYAKRLWKRNADEI